MKPGTPYRDAVRTLRVPVVEVGGSHVTGALVDLGRGAVVEGTSCTELLDPGGNAGDILGRVVDVVRQVPAIQGDSWGVALPGPFDYVRGVGLFEGVGKFEALYGVDVRSVLEERLPRHPGSITFVNDAEAFMWGEHLYGAAAGYARCVGITLGTGVGSAFFADNAVRRSGAGVPPGGRVDLLKIGGKALEEVVSTRALVREYELRTGRSVKGAADVARRARAGEDAAAGVFFRAFAQLGDELRPWLQTFDAQVLVVGGAMTRSWDLVWPAMSTGLKGGGLGSLRGLVVAVAAHPTEAALLGAAAYAERCNDVHSLRRSVLRGEPLA